MIKKRGRRIFCLADYDANDKRKAKVEEKFFYSYPEICKKGEKDPSISDALILIKQFLLCLELVVKGYQKDIPILLYALSKEIKYNLTPENEKIISLTTNLESTPSLEALAQTYTEPIIFLEHRIFSLPEEYLEVQLGLLWRFSRLRTQIIQSLLAKENDNRMFRCCERCRDNTHQNIILDCGHVFCRICLSYQVILSKLLVRKGDFQVPCPSQNCKHILSLLNMRQCAGGLSYIYLNTNEVSKNCMICGSMERMLKTTGDMYSCEDCAKNFLLPQQIRDKDCDCFCRICQEDVLHGVRTKKLSLDIFKCEKCKRKVKGQQDGFQISCGHIFCRICLKKYLEQTIELFFRCPICGYILEMEEVCSIFESREDFERIRRNLKYRWDVKMICEICNKEENFGTISKTRKVCCSNVKDKYACIMCGKEYHEKEEMCPSRKDYLNKNDKMTPCPRCPAFNDKAENKNIVLSCHNCHTRYCSECYVPISQVEAHGKAYHRKECPLYNEKESKTPIFSDRCENCVLLKSVCEPLPDLKEGDIPFIQRQLRTQYYQSFQTIYPLHTIVNQ